MASTLVGEGAVSRDWPLAPRSDRKAVLPKRGEGTVSTDGPLAPKDEVEMNAAHIKAIVHAHHDVHAACCDMLSL